MEINKEKILYFAASLQGKNKGKNAAQACEKICVVYGEDTLN